MTGAVLHLPDDFDDYAWEVEAKGWFDDVLVEFSGQSLRLAFYDEHRLAEEISESLADGHTPTFLNLVVVPKVTRASMVAAIEALEVAGELDRFRRGA